MAFTIRQRVRDCFAGAGQGNAYQTRATIGYPQHDRVEGRTLYRSGAPGSTINSISAPSRLRRRRVTWRRIQDVRSAQTELTKLSSWKALPKRLPIPQFLKNSKQPTSRNTRRR